MNFSYIILTEKDDSFSKRQEVEKKKDWGLGKKSSFRVYKKRDQRRSLGRENWGAEREIR